MWLKPYIPDKLIELYNMGYCIIVFTNQTKDWNCEQIQNVMSTLDIPVMICIGLVDKFKKPRGALFKLALTDFRWDAQASFYVGDALGRPNDWSDSDLLFANNIGLNIKTPEEMFPYKRRKNVKLDTIDEQEIVVMVGYPGSGKSTVTKQFPERYVVLSSDILKTRLLTNAKTTIKSGKSVIIDATNSSIKKRSTFINLAKERGIKIRCIHLNTSFEESLERNNERELSVPKIAYYVYRKNFETPTTQEGFYKIDTIQ